MTTCEPGNHTEAHEPVPPSEAVTAWIEWLRDTDAKVSDVALASMQLAFAYPEYARALTEAVFQSGEEKFGREVADATREQMRRRLQFFVEEWPIAT